MNITAYMRVAETKRGHKIESSSKPNREPLRDSVGNALPTAMFAIDLDVPNTLFRQEEKPVAKVTINEEDVEIAAEVSEY